MEIVSREITMVGNGSIDIQLPEQFIILNVYNILQGYTLSVLVNGIKMYDLPSSFTGSMPLGNLLAGGVNNAVTVQWFSSGVVPTFLRLLFTNQQLSAKETHGHT
jgi:hypothetical protein